MTVKIDGTNGIDTAQLRAPDGDPVAMTIGNDGKVAFPATPTPAFKAYASEAQSAANGPVKLSLQIEDFDADGSYDAPNSRFQPTVPGYYQFNYNFQTSVSGPIRSCLYKNGTELLAYGSSSGGTTWASAGSDIAYLNGTTDFMELWGVFPSGGANVAQGKAISFFSGALVRAA